MVLTDAARRKYLCLMYERHDRERDELRRENAELKRLLLAAGDKLLQLGGHLSMMAERAEKRKAI